MTLPDVFLLIGIAFVGAVAQLCLKRGAELSKQGHFLKSFFKPWVLSGITLLMVNMLGLIWVLRRLPLTLVMPITALLYILVPAGALLLFKERLRPLFWFGALLIAAGIIVIAV